MEYPEIQITRDCNRSEGIGQNVGESGHCPEEYSVFGIAFSALTRDGFFSQLKQRIGAHQPQYVVTPNLDFARLASKDSAFRNAIANATLRLCDGAILYHLLKLKRRPVPEKLSGSDLTPLVLEFAERQGYSVYLFGSEADTLQSVARRYRSAVVGWDSPPVQPRLWEDDELNARYVERIRELAPDLTLVALGAPKQELWAQKYHAATGVPVTLCIGASLDFMSHRARRSPGFLSHVCLEWTWRLIMEPRRLWKRYFNDAVFLLSNLHKV